MKARGRIFSKWAWAVVASFLGVAASAETRSFPLAGGEVRLERRADDTEVFFRALRLNRATDQWNVDVTVRNRGPRPLTGLVLLRFEAPGDTAGVAKPEGVDSEGKAFIDLTPRLAKGQLAAGAELPPFMLVLTKTARAPRVDAVVFATAATDAVTGSVVTRTLDAAGLPLPGVTAGGLVSERGGWLTFIGGEGAAVSRFDAPGRLPVFRFAATGAGVTELPPPRLTSRAADDSTLGGAKARVTPLTPQTLTAPLPLGWSPLTAAFVEFAAEPAAPVATEFTPSAAVLPGEQAVLVRWDAARPAWEVVSLVAGKGTDPVPVTLPGSGAFALVVPDAGVPAAVAGQALPASPLAPPAEQRWTATGKVMPASRPASSQPEQVTTMAQVVFRSTVGALPSGVALRCAIREEYLLRDGSRRVPPRYETFVTGHQRPGDTDAGTLTASFPLRPLLLLPGEELGEAKLTVEVLAPGTFTGRLLTPAGGTLSDGDVRLVALADVFATPQAARLTVLSPSDLAGVATGGQALVAAFELDLAGVRAGRRLLPAFAAQTPGASLVLARTVFTEGLYGLQPVERFVSDAAGGLSSVEPTSGERLPGIDGGGQYLLLQAPARSALVSGVARDRAGRPAAGLAVRVGPWLAFTDPAGRYQLLAPAGVSDVSISDPRTGDIGSTGVAVASDLAAVSADLDTLPHGPRVLAVAPADGAVNVARVTSVTLNFSRPLDPATLLGEAVKFTDASGASVPASSTLNLARTALTLLPTAQLPANARLSIALASTIADASGLTIEGLREFSFTTESDVLRRADATLVIFEPSGGVAPMVGGPGLAEPDSPVILVNETTGFTSTVLSKPDGSFSNNIPADVDDLLSSVIVNRNGTRNTVPASRQNFRDGRVGLYAAGGTIRSTGEGTPVDLIVDPASTEGKTVFKLQSIAPAAFSTLVAGKLPEGAGPVLGAFELTETGDPLTLAADVSLPVKLADLGLPPGSDPTNFVFVVVMPLRVDGHVVHQIVDTAAYLAEGPEGGRVRTQSPPFIGMLARKLAGLAASAGMTTFGSVRIASDAENPHKGETAAFGILPLLSQGPLKVGGFVRSVTKATNGTEVVEPLAGATVRILRLDDEVDPGHSPTVLDGDLVSISDERGNIGFLFNPLKATPTRALVASHPRFPFQKVQSPPFAGERGGTTVANAEMRFIEDTGDQTAVTGTAPPSVSVAQEPALPRAGLGGDDGAMIFVTGVDDRIVNTLTLKVVAATTLAGDPIALDSVPLVPVPADADLPGRKVRQFRVQLPQAGRVTLEATVTDDLNQQKKAIHAVSFGVQRPALPPGDPDDLATLRVIFSWPPTGGTNLPALTPIVLRFNRPLPAELLQAGQLDWLTFAPPHFLRRVEPTVDRREITVFYDGATEGAVKLTVGPGVKGESGRSFDQDQATKDAESFPLEFTQATAVTKVFDGQTGAGVVMLGRFAYGLERSGTTGKLRVFDLADPGEPKDVHDLTVGYPTAMALIPDYSMPGADGDCSRENLLALFTGHANEPKFLQLAKLDAGEVTLGRRLLLSGGGSDGAGRPSVAEGVNELASLSQNVKAKWDAPYLGYFELGADVTSIKLLNVASYRRVESQRGRLDSFRAGGGDDGHDENGDGDFCDPGDRLPEPSRDPLVAPGLAFSFAPKTRDERIEDFDFHAGLGLVVSVSRFLVDRPPRFSMLLAAGETNRLDAAVVSFTASDSVRRVLLLPGTTLETSTNRVVRDLALVTLGQASGDGGLAVVDVTVPSAPVLLNRFTLPPGEGSPGSIQRRSDGVLALATSRSVLLVDPKKLVLPNRGTTHPSIIGRIDGVGTGTRDFVADVSGINWVHGGATRRYLETAPRFSFVRFNALINPVVVAAQPPATVEGFLRTASTVPVVDILAPANGPGAPPVDPSRHYYVLVDAPGGAADGRGRLPLVLSAVDANGMPQPERGGTVVPAVVGDEQLNAALLNRRAIDLIFSIINLQKGAGKVAEAAGLIAKVKAAYGAAKTAKKAIDKLRNLGTALKLMPEDFTAQRLSGDPDSPLYNRFLAGPFVVLGGAPSTEQLTALKDQAARLDVDRAYLRSSPRLWVGLPSEREKGFLQIPRPFDPAPSKLRPFVAEFRLNPVAKFKGITIPGSTALIDQMARLNSLPGNPIASFFDLGEQVTLIVGLLNNLPVMGKVLSGDWKPMLMPGAHALLRVNYADRPMVLVPGFAGSKLEIDGKNEWVSLSLFEGPRQQWRLRVDTDGEPVLKTFATDALRFSLETPVGNFKPIYADWIGQLTGELGLVEYDFLKGGPGGETVRKRLRLDGEPLMGQSTSPNLFVFPYDWRLDNQRSAEQLRDYVRLALELNPDADGVDLVGHSNGGLVARAFMLLPGQRSLVKRFITVGTPWLGATKILAGLRTGDMNETSINVVTPIASVRQMLQFAPGAHQLLPTREYFDLGFRPLVEDGFDINTNGLPNEVFAFDGFMDSVAKHFLRAPAIETGRELLGSRFADNFRFEDLPGGEHPARRNTERFHAQAISDHRLDPPDVETHHIFGLSTSPDTIGQIRVRGRLVPTAATTNVVVSVARMTSFETDQVRDGTDALVSPGDGTLAVNPTNQFRLNEEVEIRYVAGDGTVPIGSLARGHGSSLDFNAPHARIHPLVGSFDDEVTGHNPMLNTEAFKELFAAIYAGRPVEEVALVISPPDRLSEGQLASLTVIGTPPPGTAGGISYVVDFGDGAVELHQGRFAESVNVPHRYRQSGTYLVTVGAATDNGIHGLTSSRVTVANVAPTVEIEGGDITVDRGETRVLLAKVKDDGLDDRHSFLWTLPGGGVSGLNQFAAPVTFDEPGTKTVRVRVTDSDGAEAEASVTVTVRADPPSQAGANFGGDSAHGEARIRRAALNGFQGGHPEIIVRVHGHAPDALDTVGLSVRQVGPDLSGPGSKILGGYFAALVDPTGSGRALADLGDALYERVILPRVSRFLGRSAKDTDYARQQRELPQEVAGIDLAAVKVEAGARGKGGPLEVDVLYLEGGTPKVLRRWEVANVATNEGVRLSFDWIALEGVLDRVAPPTLSGSPLEGNVIETIPPVFSAAGEQAAGDRSGPATVGILNPATDSVTILGRDNLTPTNKLKFFAVFDANENGRLDDDIFYPLDTNVVAFARLPKRPFAIVAVDEQGNIGGLDPFHPAETRNFLTDKAPGSDQSVYEKKLVAIRGAVRDTIREAVASPVIADRFLLDPAHLWVFEQGSGANLWKPDFVRRCNGIYLPGKSDNDYELFLPVHLETPYQFNEAGRARFEADGPHEAATLTGDWYFKRPAGLDAAGFPTQDDAAIVTWEYSLPAGSTAGGQPSFQVARRNNDDDLTAGFRSPLTPAEVIAREFTRTVTGDPGRRKLLPDTSYFPERREHFMFGHLHLQRPPEFGDDPIGDGGTGRQLLMLKWLLEGAYVTASDDDSASGLNAGAPSLPQVFTNWQHVGVPLAEGFEWGLFQDFAALKSRPFQVASIRLSDTGEGERLRILQRTADDAVAVQQASRLKKLGKSAIRATLARLAGDTNLNVLVAGVPASRLTVNPVRSFENFILELARGNEDARKVFGDFANDRDDGTEPPDLGDFLRAKNGDRDYLATIINTPGAYERFVTNTFIFLRNFVQRPTQPAYNDFTEGLRTGNRFAELRQRTDNLELVVHGRGTTQPGLLPLMADRRIAQIELPLAVEVYGPGGVGKLTVTSRRTSTRADGANSGRGIARASDPTLPDGDPVAEIQGDPDEDETVDGAAVGESLPRLEGSPLEGSVEQAITGTSGTATEPEGDGNDNSETVAAKRMALDVPAPVEPPPSNLLLGIFLDAAGAQEVVSYSADPAANRAASAGRMLRTTDRLFPRYNGQPGITPGSLFLEVKRGSDSLAFPLAERAEEPGIYVPPTGIPTTQLTLVEEDQFTFRILREGRPVTERDFTLDLFDFAAGGLDIFYRRSDRVLIPAVRDQMGGRIAGDVNFPDDWFATGQAVQLLDQWQDLVRNAGTNNPAIGQADILLLSTHGDTDGTLEDDAGAVVFDPADARPGGGGFGGASTWGRDVDWVLLASCLQLTPTSLGGSGADKWQAAFATAGRPIHGLLGAFKPIPRDMRGTYVNFLGDVNAGVNILTAYQVSMEEAGLSWATLSQGRYQNENLNLMLPDVLAVQPGDLLYNRGGLTAPVTCGRDRSGRVVVPAGGSWDQVRVHPAIRFTVRPMFDQKSPAVREKRIHRLARDLSWWKADTNSAPKGSDSAQLEAAGWRFLTNEAPAAVAFLRLEEVAPEVSGRWDAEKNFVEQTNRWTLSYQWTVGEVPLWRSRWLVSLGRDGVERLNGRRFALENAELARPAAQKPTTMESVLETTRRLTEARGWEKSRVVAVELVYADPSSLESISAPAPGDGVHEAQPHWHVVLDLRPASGKTVEHHGHLWIHALTGAVTTVIAPRP